MVGKQVTFIANLAPRKMMGMESQGMILSAEDHDGKLKLLSPIGDVEPGSAVADNAGVRDDNVNGLFFRLKVPGPHCVAG